MSKLCTIQKQNKQITYLLPVGFFGEEEGPLSQESKWHKIKDLFVFVLYVALKKRDFLENLHPVWFCLIKKRSF